MEAAYYEAYAQLQRSHWWHRARRRILARLLRRFPAPAAPGRGLEVGCGPGGYLGLLGSSAVRVGVEPHGPAARMALAQDGGARIITADGLALPLRSGAFGAVLLLDVLEHVEDDRKMLAEASRALAPGGRMLVTVPAHPWLFGVQDRVSRHVRRYTWRAFSSLLAGEPQLAVLRSGAFNSLLFPLIAPGKVLVRMLPVPPADENRISAGPLDGLLYHVFRAEGFFLPWLKFPTGVSYYAVLERSVP